MLHLFFTAWAIWGGPFVFIGLEMGNAQTDSLLMWLRFRQYLYASHTRVTGHASAAPRYLMFAC